MKIWKDGEGNEWILKITVATIKDVRSVCGVNLADISTGDILQRVANDVCLLCDVLYVIHREQCDQRGVTDQKFGELLFGDSLERATDAFMEELVDFFPARTRSLLNRAMTLGKKQMDEAYSEAEKELNKAEKTVTA